MECQRQDLLQQCHPLHTVQMQGSRWPIHCCGKWRGSENVKSQQSWTPQNNRLQMQPLHQKRSQPHEVRRLCEMRNQHQLLEEFGSQGVSWLLASQWLHHSNAQAFGDPFQVHHIGWGIDQPLAGCWNLDEDRLPTLDTGPKWHLVCPTGLQYLPVQLLHPYQSCRKRSAPDAAKNLTLSPPQLLSTCTCTCPGMHQDYTAIRLHSPNVHLHPPNEVLEVLVPFCETRVLLPVSLHGQDLQRNFWIAKLEACISVWASKNSWLNTPRLM